MNVLTEEALLSSSHRFHLPLHYSVPDNLLQMISGKPLQNNNLKYMKVAYYETFLGKKKTTPEVSVTQILASGR